MRIDKLLALNLTGVLMLRKKAVHEEVREGMKDYEALVINILN